MVAAAPQIWRLYQNGRVDENVREITADKSGTSSY
jgi:hypothetical protein